MKDNKEVISEFNEYVNMTASELEKWLETDDSSSAGWTKDGGEGESVGQDSGKKIVEILKSNPDKTPDKYTDDQLQHMRKVASYCKRHLAQESSGNNEKDPEEVKKTKSYISLKNWGHDFLKAKGKDTGSSNGGGKSGSKEKKQEKEKKEDKDDNDENEAEEDDVQEEEGEKDKKAGDKRKKSGQQNGSNKKQETRKTRSSKKNESEGEDEEADKEENGDDQDGGDDDEEEEDDGEENGNSGGKSSKKGPKKGQTVSWSWGSGNPKGKVLDVKEDKATITTKRGNEVSREGKPDDPAVILDTGKSKAIKSNHELN